MMVVWEGGRVCIIDVIMYKMLILRVSFKTSIFPFAKFFDRDLKTDSTSLKFNTSSLHYLVRHAMIFAFFSSENQILNQMLSSTGLPFSSHHGIMYQQHFFHRSVTICKRLLKATLSLWFTN